MKEQVDANVKVIAQSNGLLAPVKGSERFLSLGTGHMAAFCRAANHGCWTSIGNLQGSSKVIDIIDLRRQHAFKVMLEVGWEFLQLPADVAIAWPMALDIIQRALNASNDVASSSTELEGAVTMAEVLQQGGTDDAAIAAAVENAPP